MNLCYLSNATNFSLRKGIVRDLAALEILECDAVDW